jgi:Tol biopolymer transport system component
VSVITSNSIVIADRTGGAPKVILSGSDKWDGAADAINYPLAWSPDGKELAYGCGGEQNVGAGGQWAAMCVIDVDTGAHRMITHASDEHPLSESGPAERMNWTPDGKDIIADVLDPAPCPSFYAAGDRCGLDQVGRIDVSSGAVTLLTHTYQSFAPALSVAGTHILFSEVSPNTAPGAPYGLQIMDADGSHQRQLIDGKTTPVESGAIFSPNGADILYTAYSTADEYHQQAFEIPVSGVGKPVMLTDGNVNVYDAVWTPLLTTCTVPNLRHKTLAQAKALLRKAACTLGKVKGPASHRSKRHIVSQSLKPGRNAVAGSKVNVRIA